MSKVILYLLVLLQLLGLVSCTAASKRKSATYYHENQQAITATLSLYESLYRQQPFSAGFTDKSFTYYLMEVTTDTLRYIFNSDNNQDKLGETILKFKYDTSQIRQMARQLKVLKCLWLSKSTFYINRKKETITFLSFKSASIDKPFVENKYYVLIFLQHPVTTPSVLERIRKGELVKIDDLVYFTISSRFR